MTQRKNNLVIPKSLTPEEAAIRLEANVIKVKLLGKDVWANFSKNILAGKNKPEFVQESFNCSKEVADYILSLSLMDLHFNTAESLEEERKLLHERKAYN